MNESLCSFISLFLISLSLFFSLSLALPSILLLSPFLLLSPCMPFTNPPENPLSSHSLTHPLTPPPLLLFPQFMLPRAGKGGHFDKFTEQDLAIEKFRNFATKEKVFFVRSFVRLLFVCFHFSCLSIQFIIYFYHHIIIYKSLCQHVSIVPTSILLIVY